MPAMGLLGWWDRFLSVPGESIEDNLRKLQISKVAAVAAVAFFASFISYGHFRTPVDSFEFLFLAAASYHVVLLVIIFALKRVPPAVVISYGPISAFLLIFMDWISAASTGATRGWPFIILLIDLLLVQNVGQRIIRGIVGVTVVWLLVVASEEALRWGLFDAVDVRKHESCDCEDRPCARGVGGTVGRVITVLCVFLLDYHVTHHFASKTRAEARRVHLSVEVAEKVAAALVRFDVDEADRMVEEAESLPEKLAVAFTQQIANLRKYRPYLPDSCLQKCWEKCDESDDSVALKVSLDKAASSEGAGSTSASRSSTMSIGLASRVELRNVTLLVANLHNFLSLQSVEAIEGTMDRLVSLVTVCAHQSHGVVDTFSGDRVTISFNTARPRSTHVVSGVTCAMAMLEGWSSDVALNAAVSTGRAYCGDMGSAVMKRFEVVGAVGCWVHVLERLAVRFGVRVLVDEEVFQTGQYAFNFRMLVDTVWFAKLTTTPINLYEVVERQQAGEDEWMYQLEEAAHNPWREHSRRVKLFRDRVTCIGCLPETSPSPMLRASTDDLQQRIEQRQWARQLQICEVGVEERHTE